MAEAPDHRVIRPSPGAARPRALARLLIASLTVGVTLGVIPFVDSARASSPYTLLPVENAIGGDDESDPIVYPVTIDCAFGPAAGLPPTIKLSETAVVGKWYAFHIQRTDSSGQTCSVDGYNGHPTFGLTTISNGGTGSAFTRTKPSTYTIKSLQRDFASEPAQALASSESAAIAFLMKADTSGGFVRVRFAVTGGEVDFKIEQPDPFAPPPSPPSSSSSAPDPRTASVAVVAEQVAAAGVEGSSGGVRVRGSEVLPLTSRVSGAVGPRGGVVLDSDGMQVRVASVLGARADAGVIVPSNGVFEASVTGALLPGSVVEVWINSEPRLVAAAEVPEDGDAVTVAIPTGTPLDGGDPIEDGEHTLELRLYTEDGYEIVATGITVGQVAPTSIPAGQGPEPLSGALPLLAGAVLLGAVARRRVLVRG